MNNAQAAKALVQKMMASDRVGASQLIETLLDSDVPEYDIIHHVLHPALVRIGALWGREAVSLSQAFVAGKVAEDILAKCLANKDGTTIAHKGVIVIGNAEDDFHSLGRRIVSSFASASGWHVHDLGVDVIADEFVDCAAQVGASVIAVSAMMLTTAQNISRVRDLIDQRGLESRIKLAVGGAVFNWRPELVDEVGADGTAANAADADALFVRLASLALGEEL